MDKNFKKMDGTEMEDVGGGNIFCVTSLYDIEDASDKLTEPYYMVPNFKEGKASFFATKEDAVRLAHELGISEQIAATGSWLGKRGDYKGSGIKHRLEKILNRFQ